jgi:hypothetical protein
VSEPLGISAWRLSLHLCASDNDTLLELPELGRVVLCETVSPTAIENTPDTLYVLHLPDGRITSEEVLRQHQGWVGGGAPTIELLLQSDRVLWAKPRAVIVGGAVSAPAYLRGLAAFGFLEQALSDLEERTARYLRSASPDTNLTHRIDAAALRRWAAIGRATRDIAAARLVLVQIGSALEHPPDSLPGPARRLFLELTTQTNVPHRLEQVDARLETLWELYDVVNARLSEFSHFRREYLVEWLIVVILAAEAILLLLGLGR